MSRQVYRLNDSDDEDYLNFGAPSATAASAPAAPRLVRVLPPTRSTTTRSRAPPPEKPSTSAHRDRPDMDDIEDEPDDEIKPGKNKKIPLKSVQEHQLLINQLNSFAASVRFAPVIKECGIVMKDLRTKSVAELRELRERVRACCANSGGCGDMVSAGVLMVCGRFEAWAPKRFMDLDGYQAAVKNSPEFAALCEIIEIDSGFKSSMTPMQRMALCLGSTAATVAGINKANGAAAAATAALINNLRAQQQQQQQPSAPDANIYTYSSKNNSRDM